MTRLKHAPYLLVLMSVLFLEATVIAQVTKDVRYYNLNGKIQQPLNFFQTNVFAGANISIGWNPISGAITINSGAGGGTNAIVLTNGVLVGQIGTLNFVSGVTGYVSGAEVRLGVSAAGGSSTNVSFMSNSVYVTSMMTNLNMIAGTNIYLRANNVNGNVDVTVHVNSFILTNGFVGISVTNGLATINYVDNKTNWETTAHGTITVTNGLYVGASGTAFANEYLWDNGFALYRNILNLGGGVLSFGTTTYPLQIHSSGIDLVGASGGILPLTDNTVQLGFVNSGSDIYQRFEYGWFGPNGLYAGRISLTNLPGEGLPYLELRSTNGNSYTKFSRVSDTWKPTNYFKFSVTNPIVDQILVMNPISYVSGEANIVLTNRVLEWLNFSTNMVANTSTNLTKYLSNLWGDVGKVLVPTDGQGLIYDSAMGRWTNKTITATASAAGNSGAVQFNEGGILAGTNQLLYDRTNNRVGLNIPAVRPNVEIEIGGSSPKIWLGGTFPATNEFSISGLSTIGLSAQTLGVSNYNKFWRLPVNTGRVGSFEPGESNAQDIGSITLSTRTNYINNTIIKDNLSIYQWLNKNNDAFTFAGNNTAPIITINSNGFLIQTNSLTNYTRGNTIAAPTNTIAIGVENYAGRIMPTWFDDKALQFSSQPFFANNRIFMIFTSAGAAADVFGVSVAVPGGTTITHPAPTFSQPYMVDLACGAVSNNCAAIMTSVDLASSGTAAGAGSGRNVGEAAGYFYAVEWSDTNNISGVVGGGASRTFTGLTALATASATNLVATTNATGQYIGLYADPKQSLNMYISARDATAEFRTNTGINFVATNMYQFYLMNTHTSRFAHWKLKDLTARTEAIGWFSNNVPTNFMKMIIATKNGTNRAHSVRFSKMYLETPLTPQ